MSRFLPSFFRGVAPGTPPDVIRWPLIISGLAWTAVLGAIFAIGGRFGANCSRVQQRVTDVRE